MAVGVQSGFDRLAARLDIATSDYFPDITVQQATSMKRKYMEVQVSYNDFLNRVKQSLSSSGVSGILYAGYFALANQMRAAVTKLGYGASGVEECAVLIAQGVSRGLSLPVCEAIRDDIIGVPAPA